MFLRAACFSVDLKKHWMWSFLNVWYKADQVIPNGKEWFVKPHRMVKFRLGKIVRNDARASCFKRELVSLPSVWFPLKAFIGDGLLGISNSQDHLEPSVCTRGIVANIEQFSVRKCSAKLTTLPPEDAMRWRRSFSTWVPGLNYVVHWG